MERYKKIAFFNFLILIILVASVPVQSKIQSPSISITDVKLIQEDGKIALNIYFSQSLQDYRVFTLKEPNRIVIDIPHANIKSYLSSQIGQIETPPLKKLRMGTYPQKVRLVMDFSMEEIPSYFTVKGEKQLSIEMKKEMVKLSAPRSWLAGDLPDNSQDQKAFFPEEETPFSDYSADGQIVSLDSSDNEGSVGSAISAHEEETGKEAVSKPEGGRRLTWVKKDFKLDLKGYYKNIALASETVDHDKYFLDLNRFRLDFTGDWKDMFVLKVIYDQEGLLGNYLRTNEFQRIKSFDRHDLLDLDRELADRKDFYWHQYLYRAYLRFQSDKFNLSVGRQRIAWGTGKFWNPTDIFNPFNPIQVERDERIGVDSIDAEFFIKPMTGINLVYAPQDSSSRSKAALKFKTTVKDWDFSLLGGKSLKDKVVGGDFATTVFGGGFRGEAIYYFAHDRKNFLQFILNYDYTFRNSFYFLVEYYYNSGPLPKSEFVQLIDRGVSTLTRHLIGVNLGYDITPLLRADLYLIYGPKKEGFFVHPKVRYSLTQNLDVVGGVQWFNQRKGSEFEFDRNLFFAYIQYYF